VPTSAEVAEVVSQHEVRIRYQDSGEELTVPVGCLALPPKNTAAGK
jgi:hypothetical protein